MNCITPGVLFCFIAAGGFGVAALIGLFASIRPEVRTIRRPDPDPRRHRSMPRPTPRPRR